MKITSLYNKFVLLIVYTICLTPLLAMEKPKKILTLQKQFNALFQKNKNPFSQVEINTIENLLKKGANPNQITKFDYSLGRCYYVSPLIVAYDKEQPTLVETLLKYKANPNELHYKKTVLSHICEDFSLSNSNTNHDNVKKIIYHLACHGATLNNLFTGPTSYFGPIIPRSPNNMKQYNWITYLLIKNNVTMPTNKITKTLQNLIELKENIQEPLPVTLFYDSKKYTNTITMTFPKEVINIIFNYYSLLTDKRSEQWLAACQSVYPKNSERALSLLPFMSKKTQWRLCKNYYFNMQNSFLSSSQEKK